MSTTRYVLYARKSSESEDRQVQSIDTQLRFMHDMAARKGLTIAEEICEEHSAKRPHNRPGFDRMIEMLLKKETDAILVYHINRLSRNRLESGMLEQYLQDKVIGEIVTHDRTYFPEDNAFLLAIEGAQANQSNRDLAKVVKGGMETKARNGWFPHAAPMGYLNDRFDRTIVPDPERFATLRGAWELALEGSSIIKVAAHLKEIGYLTRKRTVVGGKPTNVSTVYNMLTNRFYTGQYLYKGELIQGNHKPMVTLAEFEKVQALLRRGAKPKRLTFTYSGLLRCGHCDCMVTAERKRKVLKGTGETKEYVLYHCTNGRGGCALKSIHEEDIDRAVASLIENMSIDPDFDVWGLQVCRRWEAEMVVSRQQTYGKQEEEMRKVEGMLDELGEMRMSRLIGDEEYLRLKEGLVAKLNRSRDDYRKFQQQYDDARREIENVFNKHEGAIQEFRTGDGPKRKQMAQDYGLRYILQDGKIIPEPHPAFRLVREAYEEALLENGVLEPLGTDSDKQKDTLTDALRSSWWARLEYLRENWMSLVSPTA